MDSHRFRGEYIKVVKSPVRAWMDSSKKTTARFLVTWLRDLGIALLVAFVLIVFVYQPVKVEGTSMMPTLSDQERIFINKFTYRFAGIERGDMVVFWFPLDKTKSYIKR